MGVLASEDFMMGASFRSALYRRGGCSVSQGEIRRGRERGTGGIFRCGGVPHRLTFLDCSHTRPLRNNRYRVSTFALRPFPAHGSSLLHPHSCKALSGLVGSLPKNKTGNLLSQAPCRVTNKGNLSWRHAHRHRRPWRRSPWRLRADEAHGRRRRHAKARCCGSCRAWLPGAPCSPCGRSRG